MPQESSRSVPQPYKMIRMVRYAARSRGGYTKNKIGIAPPRILEYGFYASLWYAILGPAVGLTAGFVGAGFLALLAGLCIIWHGSQVLEVYRPIGVPLLCGACFVVIQTLLHGESLMEEYVRAFVTWMLTLMVVRSLSLRLDFLHRFAIVALVIGLALLPFIKFTSSVSGPGRAELDRSLGLNNSNEFGAWFGFCALYFLIVGIETRRIIVRAVTWLITIGCLFVVGLTVSRGTLFAIAIAGLIAARRLLQRGFVPVLLLVIFSGMIYNLGFFDRITASYEARGTEETGRLLVWPVALERFLNAPLIGVGVSHMATYVPLKQHDITPHNAFLSIALASGFIPLVLFIMYWWRTVQGALSASTAHFSLASFALPLCIYCLIIINTSNWPFMSACVVVTTAIVRAADDYVSMLRARKWQHQGRGKYFTLGREGQRNVAIA